MTTTRSNVRSARKARSVKLNAILSGLSISKETWFRWERTQIPAERVVEVEGVTGIPRSELRPDLYEGAA